MLSIKHLPSTTIWIVTGLLVVSAFYLYLGSYLEPAVDDFCFGDRIREADGWWQNLLWDRNQYDGRWTSSLVRYGFFHLAGLEHGYWITIPLCIVSIYLGFLFSARMILRDVQHLYILPALHALVFLCTASAISDLVFWSNGLAYYTIGYLLVPLVLLMASRFASATAPPPFWQHIVLLLLTFITSGISELFLVPLWVFTLGFYIRSGNRFYLIPVLLVLLAGSALSLLAPGNDLRSAQISNDLVAVDIIVETFLYGSRGLLLPVIGLFLVSHLPPVRSLVLAVSRSAEELLSLKTRFFIALFALVFPYVIVAVMFVSLGTPGPGRAHNLSYFHLIASWPVIISVFRWLQPPVYEKVPGKIVMAIFGLTVLLGVNIKELSQDLFSGAVEDYAESVSIAVDARDSGQDIVVPQTGNKPHTVSGPYYFVSSDKNFWINRCVARYYGLRSITLE
jgi:hypothetical protein